MRLRRGVGDARAISLRGHRVFTLIITFLALLEMTRLKMTRLYQPDPLSEIFIETAMVGADAAPTEVPEPSP